MTTLEFLDKHFDGIWTMIVVCPALFVGLYAVVRSYDK
mgnify:CR=1 FL=1